MKILVFAKKRHSKDGKTFYQYLTKLTRKSGEQVSATVKFRESCGAPKSEDCPCYIEVSKDDCNFSSRELGIRDTGEIVYSNSLWVSNWRKLDEVYKDTSMDDFV